MDSYREQTTEGLGREELIRFFGVLSHDLKSPIFSIDGFSELLLADYSDRLDEDGRDFLQRVRGAAQQMRRVLDEMGHVIKLLSRPDAKRPVDLNEVVEELRLKYNNIIDDGGVQLDIPADLPTVVADPEKIREAIGALLLNALTYNDREKGQRHVSITSGSADGNQMICVADDGIGIDPRYTGQIFELGLKLDKARGEGPGYGLYVARHVAVSHGGAITVDSEPGKGSRFCISIPA